MANRTIRIVAPSRLHFGLFSFGQADGPEYGGVGAMIDARNVDLRITPAASWSGAGLYTARVLEFAMRWLSWQTESVTGACHIELLSAPRQHIGLGLGTQLGLAVATGLQAYFGLLPRTATELAFQVGRGERSAVGTHGFALGGLIVEGGKRQNENISELYNRTALPDLWRFLLFCPQDADGLAGDNERSAFDSLPPVPTETTEQLRQLACHELLPAAADNKFDCFSSALFRFGRLAGSTFASVQGGFYNGEQVTEVVNFLRQIGVEGVGQTSWGPTVFAVVPDPPTARKLLSVSSNRFGEGLEIQIASPNNCGAQITIVDE